MKMFVDSYLDSLEVCKIHEFKHNSLKSNLEKILLFYPKNLSNDESKHYWDEAMQCSEKYTHSHEWPFGSVVLQDP